MEALQKFKLLATQCAVMGTPTTSPLINIRRRRITLRMLLSRPGSGSGGSRRLQRREKGSPDRRISIKEKGNELVVVRHKLRDLFVLSPPSFDVNVSVNVREGVLVAAGLAGGGGSKRNGDKWLSLRPVSATFRQRLIRRSWKPVLVTIPE